MLGRLVFLSLLSWTWAFGHYEEAEEVRTYEVIAQGSGANGTDLTLAYEFTGTFAPMSFLRGDLYIYGTGTDKCASVRGIRSALFAFANNVISSVGGVIAPEPATLAELEAIFGGTILGITIPIMILDGDELTVDIGDYVIDENKTLREGFQNLGLTYQLVPNVPCS